MLEEAVQRRRVLLLRRLECVALRLMREQHPVVESFDWNCIDRGASATTTATTVATVATVATTVAATTATATAATLGRAGGLERLCESRGVLDGCVDEAIIGLDVVARAGLRVLLVPHRSRRGFQHIGRVGLPLQPRDKRGAQRLWRHFDPGVALEHGLDHLCPLRTGNAASEVAANGKEVVLRIGFVDAVESEQCNVLVDPDANQRVDGRHARAVELGRLVLPASLRQIEQPRARRLPALQSRTEAHLAQNTDTVGRLAGQKRQDEAVAHERKPLFRVRAAVGLLCLNRFGPSALRVLKGDPAGRLALPEMVLLRLRLGLAPHAKQRLEGGALLAVARLEHEGCNRDDRVDVVGDGGEPTAALVAKKREVLFDPLAERRRAKDAVKVRRHLVLALQPAEKSQHNASICCHGSVNHGASVAQPIQGFDAEALVLCQRLLERRRDAVESVHAARLLVALGLFKRYKRRPQLGLERHVGLFHFRQLLVENVVDGAVPSVGLRFGLELPDRWTRLREGFEPSDRLR